MGYGGLMLLPDGPRLLGECLEGPGTLSECPVQLVATCRDLWELVATCRNLSQLVWYPVALRAGPGVPIPKECRA